ncbi:MAG: Asp23/Gls24 family envelope stress response protein [Eubacteriales bacterium]
MNVESEKEFGNVEISEEVIGSIASLAALEIEGVTEMVGGITKGIAEKLGKKNLSKGVKILRNENEVSIDINLIVEFGVQIQKIGYNIQKKVKQSVEVMTGLNVVQVNVNVEGVQSKEIEQ